MILLYGSNRLVDAFTDCGPALVVLAVPGADDDASKRWYGFIYVVGGVHYYGRR